MSWWRQGGIHSRSGTRRRSKIAVPVVALTLALGISVSSYADGDAANPVCLPSKHPPITVRCQSLAITRVPIKYVDFERSITAWLATCVKYRSDNVHREINLVRDNRSLRALWDALDKNRSARIIPCYWWGQFRVQWVTFSSPDSIGVSDENPTGRTRRTCPARAKCDTNHRVSRSEGSVDCTGSHAFCRRRRY